MIEPARGPLAVPTTCPLLGLHSDPPTHYSYPRHKHRCFAAGRPVSIDRAHQAAYCLTVEYQSCPLYRQWQRTALGRAGATIQGSGATAATAVNESARPSSPGTGFRRRTRPIAALAGIVVVVLGGTFAAMASGRGPSRTGALVPAAVATATASTTASPADRPAAVPLPPSATPSLAAVAAATATPPASAPPRIHVVRPGESLGRIARQYGTTVELLAKLNSIDDPDVLEVGDRIVLPPSP